MIDAIISLLPFFVFFLIFIFQKPFRRKRVFCEKVLVSLPQENEKTAEIPSKSIQEDEVSVITKKGKSTISPRNLMLGHILLNRKEPYL